MLYRPYGVHARQGLKVATRWSGTVLLFRDLLPFREIALLAVVPTAIQDPWATSNLKLSNQKSFDRVTGSFS